MCNRKLVLAAMLALSMSSAGAVDFYPAVPVGELETFFGTTPGGISAIKPGMPDEMPVEGSGIKDSFGFVAGDVISFDYNFMTNEVDPAYSADDYAFMSIGSSVTLLDHVWGDSALSPSSPYALATGYLTFSYVVTSTGTLDFGIGIVDAYDAMADSALLIDNIKVVRAGIEDPVYTNGFLDPDNPLGTGIGDRMIGPDFHGIGPPAGGGTYQVLITTAPVPLPPALWLLFSGVAALAGFSRRQHRGNSD